MSVTEADRNLRHSQTFEVLIECAASAKPDALYAVPLSLKLIRGQMLSELAHLASPPSSASPAVLSCLREEISRLSLAIDAWEKARVASTGNQQPLQQEES